MAFVNKGVIYHWTTSKEVGIKAAELFKKWEFQKINQIEIQEINLKSIN